MMLANVPAVLLGETVTRIVPLRSVRLCAAVLFALIGIWVMLAAIGADLSSAGGPPTASAAMLSEKRKKPTVTGGPFRLVTTGVALS